MSVDTRGGKVSTSGWTETTQIPADHVIERLQQRGVRSFVYTNVDRDGMLQGPDLDEVAPHRAVVRGRFLYSGGIGSLADLEALSALRQVNLGGVIVGKALYEGRFTVARGAAGARVAARYLGPCTSSASSRAWTSTRGRVVKGTNFVDLRDAGDPVELAARYDAEGADELVFLDITATHERRDTIVELARRTADNVFVPFTIGGGIRSVADAQAVLDAGRRQGQRQLARPSPGPSSLDELAAVFGAQCVVLAIDAKARGAGRRRLGGLRRPAGARRPAATRSPGPARASSAGRGDPADLAWTATARRTATTSPSRARSPRRSACP